MTSRQIMESNPIAERPVAAFVFSLIAGLMILVGSGVITFASAPYFSGYYGPMMGGYYGMMRGFGFGTWFYAWAAIATVSGIMILVGSVMIYNRPTKVSAWGTVILVFSILSLFGMGGFFLGAILGVVGGVLALTFRKVQS